MWLYANNLKECILIHTLYVYFVIIGNSTFCNTLQYIILFLKCVNIKHLVIVSNKKIKFYRIESVVIPTYTI